MLTESCRRTARLFQVLLLLVLSRALNGCGAAYLAQATEGQLGVLRARRPIPRLLDDPATPETLRARLELVQDARSFATSALGLPDNGSYRTYADLGRPYVVWNVVAAPEFSIHPLRWCFPFTGCLSYRGYFHEASARSFAGALADRGNDTLVAGVPAYSTLGHFSDPVLNTMMRYGDLEMVSMIFHELAHQVIYFKGETQFNESFAVAVEQEGLRRWLEARGRSGELEQFRARRNADAQFTRAMISGRGELDALYRQPLPPAEMRERKRASLEAMAARVMELERQLGWRSGYHAWIESGLNNAHLASVATYSDCVPGFQQLLERRGGDLPAFYRAVRQLRRDRAGRAALCAVKSAEPATVAATP